ncbi:MAG: RHS repeat-associated core domain-containing protein [Chloroflexi bacterium]|nr:RHS repeat-associated core domain-containing protein [Chloroflexota bacterium]
MGDTFGPKHYHLLWPKCITLETEKSYRSIYPFDTPFVRRAGFDADGKRVKSVMDGETTLFVGAHYEVKNGNQITQYYLAGTTRVATLAPHCVRCSAGVRKYTIPQNMTVEYLLSDHLGSTSLTTDANGAKVLELRYKAWGEVRASWTASPTTTPAYRSPAYTYTGQYSYMDDPTTSGTEGFGLMFYNARWYDPAIGRFAQADSIVPGGVQGLDRYAYVNNSPLMYTDWSGHDPRDSSCYDRGYCKEQTDTWAKATKTTFVILVCGVKTGRACEKGSYDNKKPLSDYEEWAEENGLESEYFGFEDGDTIGDVQAKIEQFIKDNPILRFILVGHSAGADAAWNAALEQTPDNNKNFPLIHGVLLLDPGRMLISRTDINTNINALIQKGVDVKSYSSIDYQNLDTDDTVTLPAITQPTTVQAHTALAVDNTFFEQYTSPVLNGWVYGH